MPKQASFEAQPCVSTDNWRHEGDLWSIRCWDKEKKRPGATAFKRAWTEALKKIGAAPGDKVRVIIVKAD